MRFDKHLFICTNERAIGEKKSCGQAYGLELVKIFKKAIKDRGMNIAIRAQKSGCLDACDFGPAMVVYPEGVFYGALTINDIDEIIEEHLINNRPVQRLIINFTKNVI